MYKTFSFIKVLCNADKLLSVDRTGRRLVSILPSHLLSDLTPAQDETNARVNRGMNTLHQLFGGQSTELGDIQEASDEVDEMESDYPHLGGGHDSQNGRQNPLAAMSAQSSDVTSETDARNSTDSEPQLVARDVMRQLEQQPQYPNSHEAWLAAEHQMMVAGHQQDTTGSQQAAMGFQQIATGSQQAAMSFQQMATGSQQMATGSQQMTTGSQQMATGSQQMTTGFQQMTTGSQQLATGSQHMVTGSQQMVTGPQQMATGSQKVATGSQQMTTGSRQLATGSQQVATGSQQMTTGSQQMATGSQQMATSSQQTETAQQLAAGRHERRDGALEQTDGGSHHPIRESSQALTLGSVDHSNDAANQSTSSASNDLNISTLSAGELSIG